MTLREGATFVLFLIVPSAVVIVAPPWLFGPLGIALAIGLHRRGLINLPSRG